MGSEGSVEKEAQKTLFVITETPCANSLANITQMCTSRGLRKFGSGFAGPQTMTMVLTVVGIVNWGFSCTRPYWPSVYTRMPTYTDWIGRTRAESHSRTTVSPSAPLLLCRLPLAWGPVN
ncbi:hypothetical protein HPG69_000038, partial [Diceros bicornis minor]